MAEFGSEKRKHPAQPRRLLSKRTHSAHGEDPCLSQEPHPSATVVIVRDEGEALELLLLERRPRKAGAKPGPWVFPGGKVEEVDRNADNDNELGRARLAAVREVAEETGLAVDAGQLVPISRWITPQQSPRRFDTWFFITRAPEAQAVQVDGKEIAHHRWLTAQQALDAHHAGTIPLAPPTFVTTTWVKDQETAAGAIENLGNATFLTFRPKICSHPEGTAMLYPGDAGYEESDPNRAGPRHRLWALEQGYRYERDT